MLTPLHCDILLSDFSLPNLFPDRIHKQPFCLITRHLMLTRSWLASLSLARCSVIFSMDITVFTDVVAQLSSRYPCLAAVVAIQITLLFSCPVMIPFDVRSFLDLFRSQASSQTIAYTSFPSQPGSVVLLSGRVRYINSHVFSSACCLSL